MARTEVELRREAVRRRLAGESPEEIALSLGRTRQWVAKWVGRHDPADADWAAGRKRGPARAPHRTAVETETLVLAVRERLVTNPWAQVGADAISWELEKLGVEPPPRRTVERIIARAGATRRRTGRRRQPKGVPYPQVAVERPGELHEADLVGPRHLDGGVRFYALNAIDRASHRCGIEVVPSISDEQVADALLALWGRLGLPDRLQLDNGGPFVAPKGLGLIVRLCLQQGVTPRFIPAREPWRNGTVEHFNDTFDKRFFRQERFSSLAHLVERSRDFETFHNANHRYRATNGRTPTESAADSSPRRPRPLAELPAGWPAAGRVEFVRFIRSDRKLRLLNRAITMPETIVYEYVTAVLDLAVTPSEGNLRVLRAGEIVATASIKIGGR
ncbi:MAG TPA: integrase core domain-containing protein [Gaiellaceae bacterium]|nr:integrase core domain-containing protein [Gaiellaceae bacterium]